MFCVGSIAVCVGFVSVIAMLGFIAVLCVCLCLYDCDVSFFGVLCLSFCRSMFFPCCNRFLLCYCVCVCLLMFVICFLVFECCVWMRFLYCMILFVVCIHVCFIC